MGNIKQNKLPAIWIWPAYIIALGLLISIFLFNLPSYSQGSGYYEIPPGRPISVFTLCCCKKDSETNLKVIYSCKYTDDAICPQNTQSYKASIGECPNSLMFTKYSKKGETEEEEVIIYEEE